jgi:hypothetical protein
MPLLPISSTVPAAGGLGPPITTGITKVGTTVHALFAHGVASITVTTLNVGDIIILALGGGNGSTPGAQPLSIGSPNTTGWQSAGGPVYDPAFGGAVNLWYGFVVNPTVGDVIGITWNANGAGHTTYITALQFSTGIPTSVWLVDTGGSKNNVSSTTITFPPLTPGGTSELYFGAECSLEVGSTGTTPGVVYDVSSDGFVQCYDVNTSAALAPTCPQTPANTSATVAAIFQAFQAAATTNSNSVTLGTVPTGRMWVVSQIGYEILPATDATDIVASVTLNGRAVYTGQDGNGGSNQGPPYFSIRVGDVLTVSWTNVPIGSSCVGNFFYNEYSANAQPSDIGGVV